MSIVGKRFGKLIVVERSKVPNKFGKFFYECLCDCGNKKNYPAGALNRGKAKSCGCLQSHVEYQGEDKLRLYGVWSGMKQRCYNKKNRAFSHYGAKGIIVCPEWLNSFDTFVRDMGECPEGYTLDRKDGNGNYEPSNCRWVTVAQNNRNRSGAVSSRSKYKGVTFRKRDNKWCALLKGKHLRSFENEEDAALEYNRAAIIEYGEYAYLNVVEV